MNRGYGRVVGYEITAKGVAFLDAAEGGEKGGARLFSADVQPAVEAYAV